jgi:hypothetical protein
MISKAMTSRTTGSGGSGARLARVGLFPPFDLLEQGEKISQEGTIMPFIHVDLETGLTDQEKSELTQQIVEVTHAAIGSAVEHITAFCVSGPAPISSKRAAHSPASRLLLNASRLKPC